MEYLIYSVGEAGFRCDGRETTMGLECVLLGWRSRWERRASTGREATHVQILVLVEGKPAIIGLWSTAARRWEQRESDGGEYGCAVVLGVDAVESANKAGKSSKSCGVLVAKIGDAAASDDALARTRRWVLAWLDRDSPRWG